MALIAIVHLPNHTAGDVESLGQYLGALGGSDLSARVVGVYEFPNRSELKCGGNCARKGSGAWGRDRLGFMRCSICGSRNRNIRRWFVGSLFDWFGANLYPEAPALFRTPEGYGPSRDND